MSTHSIIMFSWRNKKNISALFSALSEIDLGISCGF